MGIQGLGSRQSEEGEVKDGHRCSQRVFCASVDRNSKICLKVALRRLLGHASSSGCVQVKPINVINYIFQRVNLSWVSSSVRVWHKCS